MIALLLAASLTADPGPERLRVPPEVIEQLPAPLLIAPPSADAWDVIVLTDRRPVWLRLRLTLDGELLTRRWRQFFDRYFAFADRNSDGRLSKDEFEQLPTAMVFSQQLAYLSPYLQRGVNDQFTRADIDRDGFVSAAELAGYYISALQILTVLPIASDDGTAPLIMEEFVRRLDTDGDGIVSAAELAGAPARLMTLDTDDDETISLSEIIGPAVRPPIVTTGMSRPLPTGGAIAFRPGAAPVTLGTMLLNRYDSNRDGRLSRTESGLSAVSFAVLDADADGFLLPTEMNQWGPGVPDVFLDVRLSKADSGHSVAVEAVKAADLEVTAEAGFVRLRAGDATVELAATASAYSRPGFDPRANLRASVLTQISALDTKLKGYVDRDDLMKQPIGRALEGLFALADRDGDGKLTRAEIEAYLDLMTEGVGLTAGLSFDSRRQSWFDILDTNRDGRLGMRELRSAAERFAAAGLTVNGALVRESLPKPAMQLYFFPGRQVPPQLYPPMRFRGMAPVAAATSGPLWFRKMDRNGDGDVSPREFLGTAEQFRQLDRNGDGLIDRSEAEAADPRSAAK